MSLATWPLDYCDLDAADDEDGVVCDATVDDAVAAADDVCCWQSLSDIVVVDCSEIGNQHKAHNRQIYRLLNRYSLRCGLLLHLALRIVSISDVR